MENFSSPLLLAARLIYQFEPFKPILDRRINCTSFSPIAQKLRDKSGTSTSDLFLQLETKWQQRPEIPFLVSSRDRRQVVMLQTKSQPFSSTTSTMWGWFVQDRGLNSMRVSGLQCFNAALHRSHQQQRSKSLAQALLRHVGTQTLTKQETETTANQQGEQQPKALHAPFPVRKQCHQGAGGDHQKAGAGGQGHRQPAQKNQRRNNSNASANAGNPDEQANAQPLGRKPPPSPWPCGCRARRSRQRHPNGSSGQKPHR